MEIKLLNPYRVSQRMPTCPICEKALPHREYREQHVACGMDCASWAIDHKSYYQNIPSDRKTTNLTNNDI